eukprot:TRINITY_DN4560_c0_g1_i2.p1 TRINITY_DN4560_c0_g1~~TRINITY_DN4560_c0_g1_i2.p1  ORF type:complete len:352 (-),score=37.20 TRINITY_DN4560_c0_g1_i2:200-1219(-)
MASVAAVALFLFHISAHVLAQAPTPQPTVDPSCHTIPDVDFATDYFYRSPNVPSVEACCEKCRLKPPCVAFTLSTDNTCYMKKTAGSVKESFGAVTGTLIPPLRPIETADNKSYIGSDFRNFIAASAQVCGQACDLTMRCVAYRWVSSESRCYLKDGVGELLDEEGTHSGKLSPLPSGVTPTTAYGIEFYGGDFVHFRGVLSSGECFALCSDTPPCIGYFFDPSILTCYLKSEIGPVRYVDGGFSGFLAPPLRQPIIVGGKNYHGNDLISFDCPSPISCLVACQYTRDCVAYTFSYAHNSCFLKYAIGPLVDFPDAFTATLGPAPGASAVYASTASSRK